MSPERRRRAVSEVRRRLGPKRVSERRICRVLQQPRGTQRYVKRLEDVSGVDCAIISTGSDRRETIIKKGSAVERWLA